jgi:hypothetical protein
VSLWGDETTAIKTSPSVIQEDHHHQTSCKIFRNLEATKKKFIQNTSYQNSKLSEKSKN